MIKAIVVILMLLAALYFGYAFIGYQGSVIIATETTVFEMTLISATIVGLVALFGFYLVKWLVVKLVRFALGSKNWLGSYSRRQQDKSFYISLNAYLMGDKSLALKHIGKTYGGDFHGTNYLLAADMVDESEDKKRLFAHASSEPDSQLASSVNYANQLIEGDEMVGTG